jgi:phosphatidylglycerophosphate synthase
MKPNYYSCIINQRIYQSLTPHAKKTKLHPNTFTSINIFIDFLFLIALFLYNRGSLQKIVFIPLLCCIILTHTFLDFFDGHVARVQKKTSNLGATLDHISDAFFYIPYFLYMAYVALYLKKAVNALLLGLIVLVFTVCMLTVRFNNFSHAIEYIGLYFEINRQKIPEKYKDKDAPITDFILLVLLFYVFPIYIIASK